MKSLNIRIEKTESDLEIEFSGSFTEESQFPDISKDLVGVTSVHFHMGGVDYINSLGILSWLAFIQSFEALPSQVQICFENCPEVFVTQMNSIRGFVPERAHIKSLFVPFFCESCETRQDILIKDGVDYSLDLGTYKLPEVPCSCAECAVEPDVLESNYFSFLAKKAA